jgi:hypothetical protein
MDEYDIYLKGKGYMVAKDEAGHLMAGSIQTQLSDPFTRFVSEGERSKRRSFRFKEGAGAIVDDGSKRYAFGYNIDSRSGNILRGPDAVSTTSGSNTDYAVVQAADEDTIGDRTISTAGADHHRVALKLTFGAAHDVRMCRVLVKRHSDEDYTGAPDFHVELWDDAAGQPNALVAGCQAIMSPVKTALHWFPHENLWLEHKYFWLECDFGASVNCAAADYWLVVRNEAANNVPIDWGYNGAADLETYTVATYNGAAWSVDATAFAPYCIIRDTDEIDAAVRCFAVFRGTEGGTDATRRLYAGVGPKLMYWDDATEAWVNQRGNFAAPILDMLDFNNYLFVATGAAAAGPPEGGLHYFDGDFVGGPTWVAVNAPGGEAAYCLAHHDNMIWKAEGTYGADLVGSTTGLAATWATPGKTVGDPRTPITKMISHGGKLYCVKAEGVFEITYPDGYPAGAGAGNECEANLIHDFRTDRVGRAFCMDWHSGFYFPGTGGIYQWQSSVLRDIWRERFTADENQSPLWPVYDIQKGYFRAATATTRGLVFGSFSPYIPNRGQLWVYDGQYFHPINLTWWCAEPMYACILEDRGEGYGWLWWGSGHDIFYTQWPNWTQDRSADDRCEFEYPPDCEFTLPEFDDDRPDLLKDWMEIKVRARNIGDESPEGGELLVYYALDDGAATYLGRIDGSPQDTLTFPADTTSYKIQLSCVWSGWYNGIKAYSAQIEAIDLFYQPLPDTITQLHVSIRAADHQELHNGARDTRSAVEIAAELSALLEETEPWTYRDDLGSSQCVRASGVTRQGSKAEERPSGQGKGFRPEAVIMVSMLKVADTCPS